MFMHTTNAPSQKCTFCQYLMHMYTHPHKLFVFIYFLTLLQVVFHYKKSCLSSKQQKKNKNKCTKNNFNNSFNINILIITDLTLYIDACYISNIFLQTCISFGKETEQIGLNENVERIKKFKIVPLLTTSKLPNNDSISSS